MKDEQLQYARIVTKQKQKKKKLNERERQARMEFDCENMEQIHTIWLKFM